MLLVTKPYAAAIFLSAALLFSCLTPSFAQVSEINKFTSHVEKLVNEANQLMNNQQTKSAIAKLNETNVYIESVANHELKGYFRQARNTDPSFSFSLPENLASGFSSSYWQRKYDLAQSSLKNAQGAISGVGSQKVLDNQDLAWSYMKTIYNAVKTIKDVVENVKTQSYLEAIKSAKEGIDGFIENYKDIEGKHLQKIETDSWRMHINGLIRRADRAIRRLEPVLSFMKVNAEEAQRYESLIARVNRIKAEIIADPIEKMVFGDRRFTWNYESFSKQLKELNKDLKAQLLTDADYEKSYQQVKAEARKDWKRVQKNVTNSKDKARQADFLKWANDRWEDFSKVSQDLYSAKTKEQTPQKPAKPNLFAGASPKKDKPETKKPNLFAGSDSEKTPDSPKRAESKVNLFAGANQQKSSDSTPKQTKPKKAEPKTTDKDTDKTTAIKLGSFLNNGQGNNKKRGGGTYISADLNKLDDEDIIELRVTSGNFKFVHIHLRNQQGIWLSTYNGSNRLFKVKDLIKNHRSGFTHLNFCVNGQHERYLPIACNVDIFQHKHGSQSAEIKQQFENQWSSGTGEIHNEYLATRPGLWFKDSLQTNFKTGSSPTSHTSKSSKPTKTQTAKAQNQTSDTTNKTPTISNSSANQTPKVSSTKEKNNELRELVTKNNGIIKRADAEFDKKYWKEKSPPRTTQKATNPKASTLRIMKEAVRAANSAKFPENRITLNYMVARKLINYSSRVFVYVGKQEFFNEAASCIHKASGQISKVTGKDKVSTSILYSDLGAMWRTLGAKAQVGGHAYNKNECYKLEVAAYEQALRVNPTNHKAKRALNR